MLTVWEFLNICVMWTHGRCNMFLYYLDILYIKWMFNMKIVPLLRQASNYSFICIHKYTTFIVWSFLWLICNIIDQLIIYIVLYFIIMGLGWDWSFFIIGCNEEMKYLVKSCVCMCVYVSFLKLLFLLFWT